MKKIYFKSVHLLSLRYKKAFYFKFSPNINLIYGENDTGKSSLIKSLYYTLGADVRLDKEWKDDDFISKVVISVRERDYAFVRHDKRISIFDIKNDNKLLVSSIYRIEIAKVVGDIFDFNLELSMKSSGEQYKAYPAALYLPFYIDQDNGWSRVLESFDKLGMYKDWQRNILQFHTGIRPKEYYKLQGDISTIDFKLVKVRATLQALKAAKIRFERSFGRVLFDIDLEDYQHLLQRFLVKSKELDQEEKSYRKELIDALTTRDTIESHIQEAKEQLEEIDTKSLSDILDPKDKYAIFKNKDSLRLVIPKLYEQKSEYNNKIQIIKENLKKAQDISLELKLMLQQTSGELTLQDIIRSQASKEVEYTFDEQIDELLQEVKNLEVSKEELAMEMSSYTDKRRTAEINKEFKNHLKFAQTELGINNPYVGTPTQYSNITKNETGSRAPRSVLAYHYALLKTIENRSSIAMLPIVIDSPKQQDPDKNITKKIFDLCVNDLSKNNQLIICSVSFDREVDQYNNIEMINKYSLLQEDLYDEVYEQIMPLYIP